MHNLQVLEKEIERALDVIGHLRREKQALQAQIKELQSAMKEVDVLRVENIAWQKNKNMIKLKVEKIIKNLEMLKQADE
ncbi:MAG: hypothetical protein V1653_00275, partial [bacterium]